MGNINGGSQNGEINKWIKNKIKNKEWESKKGTNC